MTSEPWATRYAVSSLERHGVLLVQDGNHGASRPVGDEILMGTKGISHIRAADISIDGHINFDAAQQLATSAYERIKKGRARGGDTLLSHKGTVGLVARVPLSTPDFLCSPQTTFWRSLDPDKIDPGFLYYFLRSPLFQAQLARRMHESDMAPYVSLTAQRSLYLELPEIGEQRRVAGVLGAIDAKIENGAAITRRLERLMQLLFEGAMRSGPTETTTLGGLGAIGGGGTPKSSEPSYWSPREVEWLTPTDMTALKAPVVLSTSRGISELGLAKSSAKLVPAGTVLMTSRATVGLTAITAAPLATNQGFITVVPDERLTSPLVLFAVRSVLPRVHALAGGSTFPEINKTNFKGIEVLIPKGKARAEFDLAAAPIFELITQKVIETGRLRGTRDQLITKLVGGTLRVADDYLADTDQPVAA